MAAFTNLIAGVFKLTLGTGERVTDVAGEFFGGVPKAVREELIVALRFGGFV
ncbi:MAG: hypothetical protein ACJAYU_004486 [Bradymonadia bacterium]